MKHTITHTILFYCCLFASTAYSESEESREYGRFPTETCRLSDMKKRAEELRANSGKKAERVSKKIKTAFECFLKQKELSGNKHNFNANLSVFRLNNRTVDDPIINASDVCMKDGRNYLLFGCPKDARGMSILFDCALQQGITLFVSLLESSDASDKFNNYWEQENLQKIPIRDGWKFRRICSRVLAKSDQEPKGTKIPKLIETTIIAERPNETRKLIHLHYEGWRDQKAMPCELLFQTLLSHIERLQKGKNTPFAVNCHGGVGRTGTTVISNFLRQEVEAKLSQGIPLDEITLNIPETIFAFRKQRAWFLEQSSQLINVYSIMGDYYEMKKAPL